MDLLISSEQWQFPVCHLDVNRIPACQLLARPVSTTKERIVHIIGACAPNNYIILGSEEYRDKGTNNFIAIGS